MRIDVFLNEDSYPGVLESLKETSYDKENGRHLTQREDLVLNFDKVKRSFANRSGCSEDCLGSVDALFQSGESLYFVEFKSKASNKQRYQIKRKASDSILLYLEETDCRLREFRTFAEFVLVYGNTDTPQADFIEESICAMANFPKAVKFGLENLKGIHFRNVRTLTPDEFEAFLETCPPERLSVGGK